VAAVSLPCIGMLPPSMIDYCLSRKLFDGVFLTGCRGGECFHRQGMDWTEQRLAGTRDPYLRSRVPRERIGKFWAAATDRHELAHELVAFHIRRAAAPSGGGSASPPPSAREAADA
jgi:coenzyme F420-reducing hydrogenase delta subunit